MPIRDHNPSGKFPIVTVAIIATNVLVFIYQITLPNQELEQFIFNYALIPSKVDFSQASTLTPFITSMFLHGGFVHIISNMLFLWVFGDNIEAAFGKIKFLLFYLLGGIAASLLQLAVTAGSSIPMLGASGAIAAILGSYLVLYPRARVDVVLPIFYFPLIFAAPASFMIVYWFITQLFSGAISVVGESAAFGGVAFFAHIGGFVFGFFVTNIFGRRKRPIDSL